MNTSGPVLLKEMIEAAYKDKLQEIEIEYQINIYKKYGKLEDFEQKENQSVV